MKWTVIARVAGRPRLLGALRGGDGFWWFEVSKGPHRAVKCSCGGSTTDHPHVDFDNVDFTHDFSVCAHIAVLYRGDAIEDKTGVDRATGFRNDLMFRLVKLTEPGKTMFYWRWTARALSA